MNADDDDTILNDSDGGSVPGGALPAGTRLGDYELEKLLGAGAMGEVYLARQVRLDQQCAVKVLPQALTQSVDFEKRFESEGRSLARLDHPHIVRVFNAGEDNGRHFLTMEYVDGGSLEDYLVKRGGKLPEAEARTALAEILSGLVYAHGKNIVHRDLKPANILRTGDGHCKIGDFGLALVAGEEYMQSVIQESVHKSQLAGYGKVKSLKPKDDAAATITADEIHTTGDVVSHTGDETLLEADVRGPSKRPSRSSEASAFVGTIDYMSPEVRDSSGAADARSDLFAVGVMAYQMLTGKKPRGRAKEPSKIVPGLSPKWDAWIFRCMEPEPTERFQSAQEALNALPKAKAGGKRWLMPLILGAVAVLALAAAGGWWFGVHQPEVRRQAQIVRIEAEARAAEVARLRAVEERKAAAERVAAEEAAKAKAEKERLDAEAAKLRAEQDRLAAEAKAKQDAFDDDVSHLRAVLNGSDAGATPETPSAPDDLSELKRLLAAAPDDLSELKRLLAAAPDESSFASAKDTFDQFKNYSTQDQSDISVDGKPLTYHGRPIVKLADGSVETVKSASGQVDGKWVVYPTIWNKKELVPDGATDADKQKGADLALKYSVETGQQLPTFNTQQEADAFSKWYSQKAREEIDASVNKSSTNPDRPQREGSYGVSGAPAAPDTLSKLKRLYADAPDEKERLDAGAAANKNWTVPDYNIEMVWIAPGSFMMGSPESEDNYQGDETQHQVTLTKGYWLGKYEVTQGQWQAVMGSNPSNFRNAGSNAPVEQVSWDDAQEFCRKLTEKERAARRLPAGYEYALPTEAQWEYACRAGTTGAYAGNGNLDSMGWFTDNSSSTTHPVGQKQPNAWGLYDMHGNVWEWCSDRYGDYPSGSVIDPTGAASGTLRVLRGGGWFNDARICRSAYRPPGGGPALRSVIFGFRLSLRSVQSESAVPVAATFSDDFPKMGVSYTVQRGDSLSRIAHRFNASVDDIRNANRISDETKIKVGQVLFIPQK
jgi:formylglycine-generating enzyme required for sulfatase activity/serine/threonine protein kinase